MESEILGAIITAGGAILATILGFLGRWAIKVRNEYQELKKSVGVLGAADPVSQSVDLGIFLHHWDMFYWELKRLMDATNLDRFLVLRAWNGVDDPSHTTAVLQIRQGTQEPIPYVNVELDSDYADRLARLKRTGHELVIVDELPDSLIKRIYQSEGVVASLWVFISAEPVLDKSRITYCSLATHQEGGFSDIEVTRMLILIDQLKGTTNL